MTRKAIDFHTHLPWGGILAVDPQQYFALPADYHGPLVVGVHPWTAVDPLESWRQIDALRDIVASRDNRIVAIGEAGLDRTRGGEMAVQCELFECQIKLAGEAGLPVVAHIVRAYDIFATIVKKYRQRVPLAVHGINANAVIVDRLNRAGVYMSVGYRTPDATIRSIAPELLLVESDGEPGPKRLFEPVIERVASLRGVTVDEIVALTRENTVRFYGTTVVTMLEAEQ